MRARTRDGAVACPSCGAATARVHGYCQRPVAEVPIDGRRVLVPVRRMRCAALDCKVQTFREQIPGVLDRYRRRTSRLSGQAGAVARELEEDGPLRGAMPGMKLGAGWGLRVVLRWFRRVAAGRKVMLGLVCRPSSPVDFGPFEAVDKFGAGVPVAGHARCCCERVCQSPD